MIYITGDRHGNFEDIQQFCEKYKTTRNDILIILGDAGINYYLKQKMPSEKIIYEDGHSKSIKIHLSNLPITFFCIHGNHEARPETIEGYKEKSWKGGIIYFQDNYPSILFAKDGECYELGRKRTLVLGGAYSVDKYYRLQLKAQGQKDAMWFPDEQMNPVTKEKIEADVLNDNVFDAVLSHTTPYRYRPTEVFLSGLDQSTVDNSMELWLDIIESKLEYSIWYAGHYHINKKIDKMQLLFEDILLFDSDKKED